jgi:hypothetical protein
LLAYRRTFGSGWDFPAVLAANLQDQNVGTTDNIVQLGYVRCGLASGPCNGSIPNDGKMYPIFTPNDNATGVIALASWYHGERP